MFRIYKIDKTRPRRYGKVTRLLYTLLFSIPSIVILFVVFSEKGNDQQNDFISIAGLIVMVFITLYLLVSKKLNAMKPIGYLEFSSRGIKKSIGDMTETYNYADIQTLRIEKFIRPFAISDSWRIYSKYIIKISINDSDTFLVVGDKSIKHKRLSILDTLELLQKKKITKIEFSP